MSGRRLSLRSALRSSFLAQSSPFRLLITPPLSTTQFFESAINNSFTSRFFSSRRASARPATTFRKERSLIDDEAELSDWISDLKTDSVRIGLSSDDETTNRDRSRGRSSSFGDRTNYRNRDRKSYTDDSFGFSDRKKGLVRKSRFTSYMTDDYEDRNNYSSRRSSRSGSDLSVARRGKKTRSFDLSEDLEESEEEEGDEIDGFFNKKRNERERRGERRGGARSSVARKGGEREMAFGGTGVKGGREKVMDFGVLEKEEIEEGEESEGFSGFEESGFGEKREKEESFDFGFGSSKLGQGEGDDDKVGVRSSGGESDSYLSEKRFDEFSLSPLTLKGVKDVGFERMTVVQAATLPVILEGKDVLAKAKTGTGKTVAFLLPAIEVVGGLPAVDRDERRPPINVLIVCPTRELAGQADQEAKKLLKYHESIGSQLVIGGTRIVLEQKRMQTNPCQILVGTPGRLRDHIENTPSFARRLKGVNVLVLDEADRLLDMGFRTDIEKIVDALPKQRQTLLFSATVPDEVRQICYIAMKRDFEFIDTVGEGSEETHSQVKQMHLIAPLEKQFPILYGILTEHISENVDYKVIVFCTTAMVTRLVAEYLSELKLNVREIHSRKPQGYRTRVSKEFKESKGLILVSSDVSARGVDYPNVTLVVQLGVPADREQYIHRLGRTGRKGKEGTGILILAPWESFFLRTIKDLPLTEAHLPLIDPDTRKKVERALAHVETKDKESAYQAWLGYYNSNKSVGRDKYQLVSLANEFSRSMGLDNPPAVPRLVLQKMGLTNIPGLRSR